MSARPTPSVLRIVQQDYVALLCVLVPVVAWGLYVGVDVLGYGRRPGAAPFFLYVAPVATAVGLLALARRVRGFARLFREGVEVEGQVTKVWFIKDRGRVELRWSQGGVVRESWRAIHRTARTEALREGQTVVLLVDPARPDVALLRDLYC
jgi:hypothetical protein